MIEPDPIDLCVSDDSDTRSTDPSLIKYQSQSLKMTVLTTRLAMFKA